MEPEELLAFAEQLGAPAAGTPSEVALRSAFSRLYYASYHVILKTLRMENLDPRDTLENHRNGRRLSNHLLVQRWMQSGPDDISRLRDALSDLYDLRQRSDYELDNTEGITSANFKLKLIQAKRNIFNTMQALQKDEKRRRAWTREIDGYEQQAAQR
jgi:DNA-binding helix-hairpin-helix protein with protein kinase domain